MSVLVRAHDLSIIKNLLVACLVAAIVPFMLYVVSREKWMGLGDTFFALWAGTLTLFPGSIVTMFIAFLMGSIYGIIRQGLQGKKDAHLAFAPFIFLASIVVILVGEIIVDWYLKILGY